MTPEIPKPERARVFTGVSPGIAKEVAVLAERVITTPVAPPGAAITLLGSPPALITSPVFVRAPEELIVSLRTFPAPLEVTRTDPVLATSTELQSGDPV